MVTEVRTDNRVAREQCFLHFLDLAEQGKRRGSSGGEKRAKRLADAVVEDVPGLDASAVAGLLEFVRLAASMPSKARDLLER